MRRILITIIILLTVNILQAQTDKYIPNVVIVKYTTQKAAVDRNHEFETLCQLKVKKNDRLFKNARTSHSQSAIRQIYKIEYEGDESPIVVAKKLSGSENIEYAQPYWIPQILDSPTDPRASSQYHLQITKAIEAQNITQGDTNIVIGIVDTGVDIYHEDLIGNIKYNYADPINGIDDDGDGYIDNYRGWDLGCDDNNPISTTDHHGTYVAGIAAATTNNGIGVAGMGGKCKFLPIKISDDIEGSLVACYEGIIYAADHGCKIINCSWGGMSQNQFCDDVVKYAISRGCIVVASAGNTGTDVKHYPASCPGVISVAASNSSDQKWRNSTYNNRVDICAPGQDIWTTTYNSKYGTSTGTSAAAPVVSGAAALIWSARPDMSASQISELMRVTADVIDTIPDNLRYRGKMGSGRLNVLKAMTDSTLPSIRITDYNFAAENGKFVSDAKISLNINIINHLKPAKNIVIKLEAEAGKASIDSVMWTIDSIGTGETKTSPTFTATLSNQLSDNEIVPFYIKVKADGYESLQVLELTVNPTFIDVEWGVMETTIANNGKIGIYDYNGQLGKGILYQGAKKLMSDGALMLALDSLTIASSYQNDNQFKCTSKPDFSENENIKKVTCSLSPTDISGIKIEEEFVFDDKLPSAMICNYLIISTRQAEYDNAALGLYFDWDIVNSLTNVISYDAARKSAYIYNTGTTNLYAGVCLLTKGNAVPYAFELSANGGSTLITDAFTDEQKWLAMNYARPQSFSTSIDLAMMLSCNNIKLHQGDTANVRFALIAAENLYELQKTADLAAELYCEKDEEPQQPIIDCISDEYSNISIYPNPATSQINIECDAPIKMIKIYRPDGVVELSENGNNASIISLNISDIPYGLHILEITDTQNKKLHKLFEVGL